MNAKPAMRPTGIPNIHIFYLLLFLPRVTLGKTCYYGLYMATRNVTFITDEHYHVFNRGNSKQVIFKNHSDYQRFINLLHLANTTENINVRNIERDHEDIFSIILESPLVKIHAACLLPNHYHILVTPIVDGGLSKFMLKLGTGYSMYFNKKYDRTGSLFEGSYKAKHTDSDEYLKYLFSYIHLNPVPRESRSLTTGFDTALNYPYSTLPVYLDHQPPRVTLGIKEITDTELLSMYLPNHNAVKREMYDWLQFDELT